MPDRHVEAAQDHGLAVLVDELPARVVTQGFTRPAAGPC